MSVPPAVQHILFVQHQKLSSQIELPISKEEEEENKFNVAHDFLFFFFHFFHQKNGKPPKENPPPETQNLNLSFFHEGSRRVEEICPVRDEPCSCALAHTVAGLGAPELCFTSSLFTCLWLLPTSQACSSPVSQRSCLKFTFFK